MTRPDPVLPRPFRAGQAGLADPFNLSDDALRWRRIRAAPEPWQRRPMIEVVDDHDRLGPDFDKDADVRPNAAVARWPVPFYFMDLEEEDDDD